jgi:hypothetical protein
MYHTKRAVGKKVYGIFWSLRTEIYFFSLFCLVVRNMLDEAILCAALSWLGVLMMGLPM